MQLHHQPFGNRPRRRPTGHFFMGYTKRYEVTGLVKSLQALGWNFVSHWPYASNTNMLCLFQRAKPAPKRGRRAKLDE